MSETDIVARLREGLSPNGTPKSMADAADLLERQASELTRMREALQRVRYLADYEGDPDTALDTIDEIARAALSPEKGDA